MFRRLFLTVIFLGFAASPAFAHLNPDEHGSLAAGFSHPLFGLDHILVMIAVGLWAWQCGGRALWIVPSAFVGTMLVGFGLALIGMPLPFVEPTILASVIAIGLLVAMAVKLPTVPAAIIVGFFALFHGYAHGGEIGSAGYVAYAAGFAIATALLHGVGLAIGLGADRIFGRENRFGTTVARILGAVTAAGGLALVVG